MITAPILSSSANVYAQPSARPGRAFLYWFTGALALLALQLLSGTGPVYAFLVFVLMIVSYQAIRWAGGLDTVQGACMLFLLIEHVLVAQIAKVCLWEPADAPLQQPLVTMGVYIVGMGSLGLGGYLSRRVFRKWNKPFFPAEMEPRRLFWISVICTVGTTALLLLTRTVGTDSSSGGAIQGGVVGPLKQLSIIYPLSVVAGTAYVLRTSKGRHSLGVLNGIAISIQVCFGVVSAGRNLIIVAVVMYILTCIAFRYRFRAKHFAALVVLLYFALYVLFPYALVARGFVRTGNFQKNIGIAADLALDVVTNPSKYHEILDTKSKANRVKISYYTNPTDTLARFALLTMSDGVIDATLKSGTTGTQTIIPGFQMLLPRIFNEDKPFIHQGNFLAHRESGLLPNKNDFSTGITVGVFADAFSAFEWAGIALIPCLIMFCFTSAYMLIINTRIWGNIFAISMIQAAAWGLSEGTIDVQILSCIQKPIVTALALFVIQYSAILIIQLSNRVDNIRYGKETGTARMAHIHRLVGSQARIQAASSRGAHGEKP